MATKPLINSHKLFAIAMVAFAALAISFAMSFSTAVNAYGVSDTPIGDVRLSVSGKPSPGMLPDECFPGAALINATGIAQMDGGRWVRHTPTGLKDQTGEFGASGARYGVATSLMVKDGYTLSTSSRFLVNGYAIDAPGKDSQTEAHFEEDGITLFCKNITVNRQTLIEVTILFPRQISAVNVGNIPRPAFGESPYVPVAAINEALGNHLSLFESESVWFYLNDQDTLFEQHTLFSNDVRYGLRMIVNVEDGFEIADNATFKINGTVIENEGFDNATFNSSTKIYVSKSTSNKKQIQLRIVFPALTSEKKLAVGGYLYFPEPVTGKTLAEVYDPINASLYRDPLTGRYDQAHVQWPRVEFPKETGLTRTYACDYLIDDGSDNPRMLFLESVFEEGKKYMVKGHFKLIDGYEFADNFELRVNDQVFTLNDLHCTMDGKWWFEYKFGQNKTIKSVSANVVTPVPGQMPSYSVTVPADAGYTATVEWYPATSTIQKVTSAFKSGIVYKAHVTFTAKDGYSFPDAMHTDVVVNGKNARFQNHDGAASYSHKSITYAQQFASGEGVDGYVTTVKVTGATKAKPGEKPNYASLKVNTGLKIDSENTMYYYLDPVYGSRRMVQVNDTFQEGVDYKIQVGVVPEAGYFLYEFAPMSVNGTSVATTYVYLGAGKDSITGNYEFNGADDEEVVVGTEDEVEEAILNSSSDEGPADAYFTPLRAKATTFGTTSYKLSWLAVDGAAKYKVYGNKCGTSYKYEYKGETAGTSVTMKGMKKGTYYKHMVVAVDDAGKVIAVSKAIHACTTGGKYTNYKYVKTKAKNSAVTLKKGKTFSLKASTVRYSSKKTVKVHRGKKYLSSDKAIATVSSLGKITAKAKGTCYVYVYTQNGAYKRIKVTVK